MKPRLRVSDLWWALLVGTATLVANGTPLGNGGVEADALNGLVYNVLQFGLPAVALVRWADAAVDADRLPPLLAYPAVVLATVGLGVWVIAPALWPVLGKAEWWGDDADWNLASSTLIWHTLGMAVYAHMRLSARAQERLLAAQRRTSERERALAAAHLLTLQARVDPGLLFERLQCIAAELQAAPLRAQARLAALIDLLRAQQPHLEAEVSTLAREVQVLRAYARLMSHDAQHTERLHLAGLDDAPEWPLAPMVLLPLVRPLLDEGTTLWSLSLHSVPGRAELRLQALGPDAERTGRKAATVPVAELAQRLRAVHGDAASLTLLIEDMPLFKLAWPT